MQYVNFVVYDANGVIVRAGTCPDTDLALQAGTDTVIQGYGHPDTHYVSGGNIVARADLDSICTLTNTGGWTANGVDVLSYGPALPNPTRVTIASEDPLTIVPAPFDVTDGTLELTTTTPGSYRIILEGFPFLTKIIEVTTV